MVKTKNFRWSREEFYRGAKKATRFINFTQQIIEEESNKLIDEVYLQQCQAQSEMMHRVVGT